MSNHVPTPYECSNRNWRNEEDELHYYITGDRHMSYDTNPDDEDGDEIESGESCTSVAIVPGNATSGDIAEDTAKFIVRACNSHDELLAACKATVEMFDAMLSMFGGLEGKEGSVRHMLVSAIANAEVGQCQAKSS